MPDRGERRGHRGRRHPAVRFAAAGPPGLFPSTTKSSPMSTTTAIAPLKKVQFMQTSNATVCGLQLTDFNDREFTAGVDAGGLAFVIAALLEQASHPAFSAASR